MFRHRLVACGLGVGLLAAPTFAAEKGEKEEAEESHQAITLDQLPPAVKTSLEREAKGKRIEEIEKETESNGQLRYEAEVVSGNKGTELEFNQAGKVVKRETHSESKEKEHQGPAE